jgi:hypothetical protein
MIDCLEYFRTWRWRLYVTLKRRRTFTRLHGGASQDYILLQYSVSKSYLIHVSMRKFSLIWVYSFSAYFPYLKKNRLMRSPCCLCVYVFPLVHFWMPKSIFMKLNMHIITPKPSSMAYFINLSHQSVLSNSWVKPLPRQRKNCSTRRFLCGPCRIKGNQVNSSSQNFLFQFEVNFVYKTEKQANKTNSGALDRQRTIPAELPPLVGEVSVNFSGQRVRGCRVVSAKNPHGR